MNREIKFRAFVETYTGKEMVYDWCFLNKADNHFNAVDLTNERPDIGEVYAVMQFTGLHDKNGKEIYEGDVVKMPNWSYPVEVIYSLPKCRFCCKLIGGVNDFIPQNSEIIGNIFENPELLTP